MRNCLSLIMLLGLGACGPKVALAEPHTADVEQVGILDSTRFSLDNGLDVVLHRDSRLPLVALNLTYHVGAGHDGAHPGLAHVAEHVMFRGTPNMPDGEFGTRMWTAGARRTNASTVHDRTSYHSVVPSSQLPLALWLESDRMANTVAYLDKIKLAEEIKTVTDEERDRVDATHFGPALREVRSVLFPPGHGQHPDPPEAIRRLRISDVHDFLGRYYGPANATLVLAGDLPNDARAQVERFFGRRSGGERPARAAVPHTPAAEERVIRRQDDDSAISLVVMAWQSPAYLRPGDAEADMVASVLNAALNQRIANNSAPVGTLSASASQRSRPDDGLLTITAHAEAATPPTALRDFVDSVLDGMRATALPVADLRRARQTARVQSLRSLQTLQGRAERMQLYVACGHEPDFLDEDLARYDSVDASSAKRFVEEYLAPERRVVLMSAGHGGTQ